MLLLALSAPCVRAIGGVRRHRNLGETTRRARISASPMQVCGLPALHYEDSNFVGVYTLLGEGGFGSVRALDRAVAPADEVNPLELPAFHHHQKLAIKAPLTAEKKYLSLTENEKKVWMKKDFRDLVVMATKEAAIALLVCSGHSCPPGAPFPAFTGMKFTLDIGIPSLVSEYAIGAEFSSVMKDSTFQFLMTVAIRAVSGREFGSASENANMFFPALRPL